TFELLSTATPGDDTSDSSASGVVSIWLRVDLCAPCAQETNLGPPHIKPTTSTVSQPEKVKLLGPKIYASSGNPLLQCSLEDLA
ncbi:unnamed protein product, partial [Amoebophrya sp. A25]